MLTFLQALRRHAMLESVVTPANEATAAAVYAGVTGQGGIENGIAVAVADTAPREYVVLVATDDIAAAFASVCLLDAFRTEPPHRTPRDARRVADKGWQAFRALADQAGHLEHGLGADMSAAWPVLKAVQELRPDPEKMRRIATLAGRMYAALKGKKERRAANIPEEVVGVETGGDITALLPGEYALLATDPTKRHLFRQLTERRVLQFERRGKETKGRGPLVIALDESGSMQHHRDEWAKAAMTALTRIAWEDKRPVVVVHFSTATRVQILKPGDSAGVVKAQHTFLDGGTNIGRAMMVASDEVKNLETAGHRGADVVLVSDGGDAGSSVPAALTELQRRGARLWSIAIDTPFVGALRDEAAEYVHLTDADLRKTDGALRVGGAVGA
jgi:Mg-chelatase subunit ChlD